MPETLTIISERVDDIPLLLAQLERMGVQPLLDEYFPTYGNWVGLSQGWVTVIWLTHILLRKGGVRNRIMEVSCALQNVRVRLTPWQPKVESA